MRETTESDSRTHRVTITKKGRSVIERSEPDVLGNGKSDV